MLGSALPRGRPCPLPGSVRQLPRCHRTYVHASAPRAQPSARWLGPGSSLATMPHPGPPEQASSKAIPAPGARPRQRLRCRPRPCRARPLAPSPTAPRPGARRAAGTAPRAPTPPVGFGSLAHTLPDRESHSVLMDSGLNDELQNVSDVQKAGVWCPHTCQHSANATSYRDTTF